MSNGLFHFRSPLLAESLLMSFPPGTEMFQFPGFASYTYVFSAGSPCGGVAPFGYLRINDRSHLPAAFRSVPRPSSPLSAKASTECPYLTPFPPLPHPHAGPSTPKPLRSSIRASAPQQICAAGTIQCLNYYTPIQIHLSKQHARIHP
jgi:hypothetical protein